MSATFLEIGNIQFPVGSDRGITQTLDFEDNGEIIRTVNGDLKDVTRPENRKYQSQISASDLAAPALVGKWKGTVFTIKCIPEIFQDVDPAFTDVTLERDPVLGTIVGVEADGTRNDPDTVGGVGNRDITFLVNIVFVEFRPEITFMVEGFNQNKNEFSIDVGWTLNLREV